jgi:hypothetical protein
MTFEDALSAWSAAATDHVAARETYRLAHGKAALEATAKNAEARCRLLLMHRFMNAP